MSKITRMRKVAAKSAAADTPQHQSDEAADNLAFPIKVALAMLAFFAVGALAIFLWDNFSGRGSDSRTITYETRAGANTGRPDSPLNVIVRLPWRDGEPGSAIVSVSLSLLDETGNPASFGPTNPSGVAMRQAAEMGAWQFSGSTPSEPGQYKARLTIRRLAKGSVAETVDLDEPKLVVTADKGPSLDSGYVFTRDNDLWLLATDISREKRLTFFAGQGSAASEPTWSPNGTRIAFTFAPSRPASELPSTEIWQIAPDGTGLQRVVEPGPEETLLHPAWSEGGTHIYFSVDRLSNESLPPGPPNEVLAEFRRVDKIDLVTGRREQLFRGAQWPVTGPDGKNLLYLEDAPPATVDGAPREKLVLVRPDGEKVTVVEPGSFLKVHAPSISPDGKWVAFSTFTEVVPGKDGFNLLDWLLFKPRTARAHDAPWDVFLVSTQPGSKAKAVTAIGEDEPTTVWLDNQTLAILGERALYRLELNARGESRGEPVRLREGVKHGEISWHAP